MAARGPNSAEAMAALEQLCRSYWYPLYAYVRRRGHNVHDAQDLTQAFFARLLQKNYLGSVDRSRGRFRSFLLASINHFLSDELDRAQAEKRGGKHTFVFFDDDSAEDRYLLEPADPISPETLFERRWAGLVLERALARLRQQFFAAGRAEQFDLLKVFLEGEPGSGEYEAVGARLQMSAGTVAVAVHRLRRAYRNLVRAEVAQTVADAADIDEEIRQLFRVVSG